MVSDPKMTYFGVVLGVVGRAFHALPIAYRGHEGVPKVITEVVTFDVPRVDRLIN